MLEWIYNRNGRAVALNCDDCVFDSNGCFRLWKLENNLYNMNGNHVGWVEGGVFYDSQNPVLVLHVTILNSFHQPRGFVGHPVTLESVASLVVRDSPECRGVLDIADGRLF